MLSKKTKILRMVEKNPNMSAGEIAEKLNVKRQYVHSVMYLQRKKGNTVTVRVAPVRDESAEVDALRREVADLYAVIRYLERRLKNASTV